MLSFRPVLPLSTTPQVVYLNSPLKLDAPSHYKRTNQFQYRHIFPNSNLLRHRIYVVRIPTTSGTRRPSCGTSISKKGKVLSGSCERIHGSLLLWSRRNNQRKTRHTRIV